MLCTFFWQKICILSPKQWNRKLQSENYPRIQHCVTRTANIRSAEQQNCFLIALEFLFLRPANFPQTVMWPFMLAVLDHPALGQWYSRDRNLRDWDLVKKLRDRDFINNFATETSSKIPRPRLETWNSRPRFETSELWIFPKLSSPLPRWFFRISGIVRPVLVVSYL